MSWHLILFCDSAHPSHERLCRVVAELLPENGVVCGTRPLGRYYCSLWRGLDEEVARAMFFRLLDGDLKACLRYILETDEASVTATVERCMASVMKKRVDAETMWVTLKAKQPREFDVDKNV